ncbi:vitamin B6 photo-protection and homoeostasis-domain-containing protein [Cyathus striatus]|nr:vitamin B6 photo-protection and homoeostasis-domain-containing protein [Cyathus striatus]
MGPESIAITERDEAGRYYKTEISTGKARYGMAMERDPSANATSAHLLDLVRKVFLPAGYPHSVSPDYMRYQILNALQAFCNSLASLLSSRAILEGFGVGDPSATATHALLLTVLQDIFSRLTTILGAYYIGSSLVPEAKTYRLLADILNDSAVILDTLSPLLVATGIPGIRVVGLCISASLRSLCGIAAGGSKAAITLHFASPIGSSGDVGDLNAKDASKETVLALLGMMLGTLIVPRLTTQSSTYSVLFLLVGLHLTINYYGVRGLALRTLNRQRVGAAWMIYRDSGSSQVPNPEQMSVVERIFDRPGVLRDVQTDVVIGHCSIGSSASRISHALTASVFNVFKKERYLLWYDEEYLRTSVHDIIPRLHICLKDGYTLEDQLRAWAHATELCRSISSAGKAKGFNYGNPLDALQTSHRWMTELFSEFLENLRSVGWNTAEGALITGSPKAILTVIDLSGTKYDLEKKRI